MASHDRCYLPSHRQLLPEPSPIAFAIAIAYPTVQSHRDLGRLATSQLHRPVLLPKPPSASAPFVVGLARLQLGNYAPPRGPKRSALSGLRPRQRPPRYSPVRLHRYQISHLIFLSRFASIPHAFATIRPPSSIQSPRDSSATTSHNRQRGLFLISHPFSPQLWIASLCLARISSRNGVNRVWQLRSSYRPETQFRSWWDATANVYFSDRTSAEIPRCPSVTYVDSHLNSTLLRDVESSVPLRSTKQSRSERTHQADCLFHFRFCPRTMARMDHGVVAS